MGKPVPSSEYLIDIETFAFLTFEGQVGRGCGLFLIPICTWGTVTQKSHQAVASIASGYKSRPWRQWSFDRPEELSSGAIPLFSFSAFFVDGPVRSGLVFTSANRLFYSVKNTLAFLLEGYWKLLFLASYEQSPSSNIR